MTLQYTYSPALLPDLSQINVIVNDVVAGSIPLPKESRQHADCQGRDPGQAHHRIQSPEPAVHRSLHHGMRRPLHSSLWARVANGSTLDLQTTRCR
jgi:hypothetical protein